MPEYSTYYRDPQAGGRGVVGEGLSKIVGNYANKIEFCNVKAIS